MKKYLSIFAVLMIGAFTNLTAQDVNVTFQIDMSYQAATGYFDPATEVVTIAGGFNEWLNEPPPNADKQMDDSDGDLIYSITVAMAGSASYEYKYNIGLGWDGKDEFQGQPNRSVDVGTTDMTVDVVSFNDEGTAQGAVATVTFNANVELLFKQGAIDATTRIGVAGDFTDWGTSSYELTDPDGDSTYSGTFSQRFDGNDMLGGETLQFKWVWGDVSALNWETFADNRTLLLIDGEQEFTAFWDNEDPNVQLVDGNITFNVDMSVLEEVGLFDAAVDSMQVRGGFNGWNGADVPRSHMSQNFLNTTQWFLPVSFEQAQISSQQDYKFFVQPVDSFKGKPFIWSDGWERPYSQGGGNRPVIYEGTDAQEVPIVYYDDIHPDYVIKPGTTTSITFRVDMTIAADDQQQVPTFIPGVDSLWWINEQPAFTNNQGWEDTDDMRVLLLTDSDGDMIYEATLTVSGPSWNGFQYRYGFTQDGGFTHEIAGFGSFAYRVRYIEQTGPNAFADNYEAPVDTWALQENKSDQWEDGPQGITSVKDLGLVANSFELEQNYPNPFNPSTVIRFSIPEDNFVSIKVFNLLGEEVATMLNDELKAGSYDVKVNAGEWGSGVYFYSIQAGSYSATKKMMLLK